MFALTSISNQRASVVLTLTREYLIFYMYEFCPTKKFNSIKLEEISPYPSGNTFQSK